MRDNNNDASDEEIQVHAEALKCISLLSDSVDLASTFHIIFLLPTHDLNHLTDTRFHFFS